MSAALGTILLAVAVAPVPRDPVAERAAAEIKHLKGLWSLEEIYIDGDRFPLDEVEREYGVFEFDGKWAKWLFNKWLKIEIDVTARPPRMIVSEGHILPARSGEEPRLEIVSTTRCVYKLSGDRLTITCRSDKRGFPDAVVDKPTAGVTVVILKRRIERAPYPRPVR